MKILPVNNGIVIRIEFYQPYPPAPGYYTFNAVGNSAEEIISELCRMKRINTSYISDKCILVSSIDCVSTGLSDYLIHNYQEEYHQKTQQQNKNMDDFLKRNPTKPANSRLVEAEDTVFSVL